jgi:4-diphosphocytidyl-2-C-methyl-D-erythritol kinase
MTRPAIPVPSGVVYKFCPAKINIGLLIRYKRPDGYHELESLFYPVEDLYDELALSAHPEEAEPILMTSGRPIPGNPYDNLVLKAYWLLKADYPALTPVRIHLHKRIPAGAGLGGGSSNAARMLLALRELFQLELSDEALQGYARQLGADVPFFLQEQPMLVRGIGDQLTPFQLQQQFRVKVLTPALHSDTATAYRNLELNEASARADLSKLLQTPLSQWRDRLWNDFEASVFAQHPQLAAYKAKLYEMGALYASMSGSGTALFGLFAQDN